MSHNNGLIQADVDLIGDVKAVLGVNSDDQSALCTYAGMNIWAKYKPVKWLGDVRYSTWWQAYNQRCGINIGYADDLVQLIQQWLQVSGYSWRGFWQYDAIADPYPTRLMDFNGYQHGNVDNMQPWDSYTFPNEITRYYEAGDYTFSALATLSKRIIDDYLLTLADIKVPYGAGYLDLGSMYFGIAIVKQNGSNYEYAFQTSYYDFATDVSQLPEPHMDGSYGLRLRQTPHLTKYTLPSLGNYLIFPFLSRDRLWDNGIYTGNVESNPIFLYPRQSFPGLFVPLFHSGKAVTMVDQPVYVELTLTAAKRSNSYGVDLTLAAHNTMSVARELPERYLTYSFIVYPQLADGSYDYQNGRTYTAVWGTGTPSIAAGGSITLTTYVEFTNYGVIGGYISNIHVSSSYGWITRNVTAPSITYGGFATGIKIVDAGGMEISTLIIERSHTSRVYYKLIPSDAYGGASWSSSNPAIATVNAGAIQALRTGTCTIYCAYSEDNTIYASLSLTVTPLRVTGIDITTWYTNMVVGQTYQWAAAVVPSNADDQGIIWSSGNTSVATVDQNGVVTPVGAGGTYITATSHDGGYTASVNVAVTVPVVMTGIRITGAPASLAVGSSMTLNCYADYSDGTSVDISSSVTWTYDNTIFSQTGTRTWEAIRTGGGAIGADYQSFTNSVYVSTTAQLTNVSISPSSKTLYVGDSFSCAVSATYWDGTSYTTQDVTSSVTWTKPSFLSRSGNTFTATSAGSGSIKASYGGYSPTCSVTAVAKVAVTGINITTYYTNMVVGQTYQWAAAVTPSNAYDQGIIWSSGNTSVATVDQNGVVTPVGAGGTYITATSHDGGYTASVNVAVTVPVVMTGIRITGAPASLAVGSSMTLGCYADYSDGTSVDISSSVTWTYDNTIFSQTGTRTWEVIRTGGGAIGADYQSFTNSVYVSTTAQLTNVSISPSSKTLYVGDSFSCAVSATYWDGTSYTTQDVTSSVTWTKPSFLSRSGNTFTATSAGSGSIKASYGGYSPTCSVTAVAKVAVTGINITTYYTNMVVGQTYQWTAAVTPSNAYDQGIIWSSGNTSVATVDQNGVVTPVGAGGTYITATSHDGGYQASANVAVTVPVVMTGIRITGAPASLAVGSSMTLGCYADYSDGTSVDISSSVTWTYDNTIFSQTGTRTWEAIRTGGGAIGADYQSFTNSVYVSTTAQLTNVSISPSSKTLYVGDSFSCAVSATYWDGTSYTTQDVTSSVTWTKPSFLSRSGNTFTATSAGSGNIKASFGGYAPTCSVTVSVPSTQSVDILDSYGDVVTGDIIDMVVSDTIQLTAYSDGTITSVDWSSSAVGVARVTGSTSTTCTIGARSAGTANITLKLNGDNNLTATVTIRVSSQPI